MSSTRAKLLRWLHTVWVSLASIVGLVLLLLVWAAQMRGCFVSTPRGTRSPLVPHSPRLRSAADRRLTGRLSNAWASFSPVDEPLTVWIVDDDAVNAASLGDGAFVLWSGLAKLSDASLDAALAHELAHDQLHHARKASDLADVSDFLAEAIGTFSGSDADTTATLKRWSGNLVIPHYSRQQETEADARAVGLLHAMGYPDGAGTMCVALKRLRAEVGEGGGGWFSSHPGLTDRIRAIREAHPTVADNSECR